MHPLGDALYSVYKLESLDHVLILLCHGLQIPLSKQILVDGTSSGYRYRLF